MADKANMETEVIIMAARDIRLPVPKTIVYKEEQEQANISYGPKTWGRVRKSVSPKGETKYVYTQKQQVSDIAQTEDNEDVSPGFFNLYRKGCHVFMHKKRYVYDDKNVPIFINGHTVTVPALRFEIDIFFKDRKECKLLKIDVELDSVIAFLKPYIKPKNEITFDLDRLPMKLTNVQYVSFENGSPGRALLDGLVEVYYVPKY